MPDEAWGRVTEEGLNRLLERVGKPRRGRSSLFYNEWAYRDSRLAITPELVNRYSIGIADRNPLFIDAEYAAGSIWGRCQAPQLVTAWTETANGATEGFAGCHTIWRSCEFEWERPVFVGEEIAGTTVLKEARIVESGFSGTSAVQDYETTDETAEGELIGYYRTSWHRFSRGQAKKSSKHGSVDRPQWTDDQLQGIWGEYRKQNFCRRGPEPLYWEDVEEGIDIPHIVKGPITLTSKLAFEGINFPGGWVVGHELALALWERYPGLAIRNEENALEPPVSIHWTNDRCQKYLGMPAAYEAGYERLHWFGQMLMSWMGDHGMLRKMSVRFKGFHWQGDVIRLYGKVGAKEVVGDRHLVHLSIEARTHRDEVTTVGQAVVQLPSRADGKSVWTKK